LASSNVVSDFRDLVCWQLSYELKCEVFAFASSGEAAKDFKYRDQIRDSSASGPRNIAEGFRPFCARDRVTSMTACISV
jgi:four helix bundle protein